MQKEYRGKRLDTGVEVTVDGSPLDPRYDLRRLSQSGFEWGYGGAGPMQLALAILADHFGGDGSRALNGYTLFCRTAPRRRRTDRRPATEESLHHPKGRLGGPEVE